MKRRTFVGAGALTLLGSLSGCLDLGVLQRRAEVSESVDRSYAPADVSEVAVRNTIGDVTITARDVESIDVHVLKRSTNGREGLDDIEVRTTLDGGALTVETILDRRAEWFNRSTPSTDVTISVPRGDGGPAIGSIQSDLGDVTLLDTRGDATAQTNLGDVTATGVDGYLSLRSNLGTILAADSTGLDAVHTDLGDVKVDLLGLRGDVEISTELGEVIVGVADDLDLDVLAESDSAVDSDLPLSDVRSSDGRFSGQLNDGGSRVHVFSDLGDVSLRAIQR